MATILSTARTNRTVFSSRRKNRRPAPFWSESRRMENMTVTACCTVQTTVPGNPNYLSSCCLIAWQAHRNVPLQQGHVLRRYTKFFTTQFPRPR